MGAWGVDSFENDEAADWLSRFCDNPSEALISEALRAVMEVEPESYLEEPESCVAIAAAEVIAALKGVPNANLSQEARKCISDSKITPDSAMVSLALKALERIKTDSELKELWEESANPDEWYQPVNNLEERLRK
jgi:hypothetical protein